MKDFFDNLVSIASEINITDIIDILIVAYLIYKILGFIRKTRAEMLVRGILLLLAVMFLSGMLHLYVLNWMLKSVFTMGLFAVVVLFQPELRRGLEQMGHGRFFRLKNQKAEMSAYEMTGEIAKAVETASNQRVGMLIVFERETALEEICETGTRVDADISANMIGNLFYEGAPLHDGAAVVRNGKIYAAGCVLPLTANKNLPSELGTRHRAGIGITENSDAISLIVSEETGAVSIAEAGMILRHIDIETVKNELLKLFTSEEDDKLTEIKRTLRTIGRRKNV